MTCLIRECTLHPHAPYQSEPIVAMDRAQRQEAERNKELAQQLIYFWADMLDERPLAEIAAI
jgi:hypothetical protein